MKKLGLFLLIVFGLLVSSTAHAYVYVGGYYNSYGTYVSPYVRSTPNAYRYDNYGYTGGSLYNSSYYSPTKSYSSSWYTPSYSTDSSYYLGKSLYNSGLAYPSYTSFSTPSLSSYNSYSGLFSY